MSRELWYRLGVGVIVAVHVIAGAALDASAWWLSADLLGLAFLVRSMSVGVPGTETADE